MQTYHQYCPISRASEILAQRWTPLIIRNLLYGVDTFSELARGLPTMSRSMLIRRLGELERAGVVTKVPKEDGPGHSYGLTEAGSDLAGVIETMGEWGEKWLEVTTEHADPGFALWSWCRFQVNPEALPQERTVVSFTFPDQPPTNRRYWLLVEHGEVELCYSDPGDEPAVHIEARSLPFVNWHRGRLRWWDAVRNGEIHVRGRRDVARSIPEWNLHASRVS